jgi:cell division protein FtsW (lipid II flippase)
MRDRWARVCGFLTVIGFLLVTLQPSVWTYMRWFAGGACVAGVIAAWIFRQRHANTQANHAPAQVQNAERQRMWLCVFFAVAMLMVAVLPDDFWRGLGAAMLVMFGIATLLLSALKPPAKKPG